MQIVNCFVLKIDIYLISRYLIIFVPTNRQPKEREQGVASVVSSRITYRLYITTIDANMMESTQLLIGSVSPQRIRHLRRHYGINEDAISRLKRIDRIEDFLGPKGISMHIGKCRGIGPVKHHSTIRNISTIAIFPNLAEIAI